MTPSASPTTPLAERSTPDADPATPHTNPSTTVATMRPGDRLTVSSIDGPAADELAREGVLPGVEIALVSRAPLGGPFVVDVGGARLAISADVAVQVRPGPRSAGPGRA